MKIAILSISNGLIERGAEVFVKEIASYLAINHEVCVFQLGKMKREEYKVKQILSGFFSSFQDRSATGLIKKNIFQILYDISVFLFTVKCVPILLSSHYDWIIPINGRTQVVICRLLRYIGKFKILISGQSGIGFDDRFNILIGKPDVFISLTTKAYKWARSFSSSKIAMIPNGVDIQMFHPFDVKPVKKDSSRMVLCVSALLPYKNIDTLILAVSKLKNTRLQLIGDGPQRNKIIALATSLLGNRFLYMPFVPHDKLFSFYQRADVFSLPSMESEAFGIVYIEAMACNIPVVAPDYESRREILGQACIYFQPGNIDDYVSCLQTALTTNFDDKPRKQAQRFTWLHISKQYEKIMEQN